MWIKPEYNFLPKNHPILKKIYRIIYFSDSKKGISFDILLLIMIIISTLIIIMESVSEINQKYSKLFYALEWIISIIFTIEYILRIICIRDYKKYVYSPMGIIDFLAIIPFYLSLILPVTRFFLIIRLLRLLRIFRIFNLFNYLIDAQYIIQSLRKSARKIYIFLLFIAIIVVLIGSLMYIIEGKENGFTDIPTSIYWAVVTITTVGYGDISPITPLGKFLSVILMLCGYSVIAVPTGIVTADLQNPLVKKRECPRCGNKNNDDDARYCKTCGEKL